MKALISWLQKDMSHFDRGGLEFCAVCRHICCKGFRCRCCIERYMQPMAGV